jgi:hypothetical protein
MDQGYSPFTLHLPARSYESHCSQPVIQREWETRIWDTQIVGGGLSSHFFV